MRALVVIALEKSQRIPLISLLTPATPHDSHVMMPLINLSKAIGLDLKRNLEKNRLYVTDRFFS